MRSQPRWAAEHGATCLPLASEDSIVRSAVWIHGMCSKAMRRKALRTKPPGSPQAVPTLNHHDSSCPSLTCRRSGGHNGASGLWRPSRSRRPSASGKIRSRGCVQPEPLFASFCFGARSCCCDSSRCLVRSTFVRGVWGHLQIPSPCMEQLSTPRNTPTELWFVPPFSWTASQVG